MNKKILLLPMFFVLLSFKVFATINFQDNFDDGDVSDWTNNVGVNSINFFSSPYSINETGTNEATSVYSTSYGVSTNYREVSYRIIKTGTFSSSSDFCYNYGKDINGVNQWYSITLNYPTNGNFGYQKFDGGSWTDTGISHLNDWNNVTVHLDNTTGRTWAYFNGVLGFNYTITDYTPTGDDYFGFYHGGNGRCSIDDVCSSDTEGSCPINTIVTVNESTEGIIINRQIGSVSFGNTGVNNVISDIDFNVTVNDTPYYFGHTFQINAGAGGSKQVTCEVLRDNEVVGTTTRTMSSSSTASAYILTDLLSNNTGEYNEVLRCRKDSGTGLITINKAVCAGHLLVDTFNNTLNYNFTKLQDVWANSTSFRTFLEIPFTVSNKTVDADHTIDLIVDYSAIFNHSTEDLIVVDVDFSDGQSCTQMRRDSNSGGTGIGGNVCLFKNVTGGEQYNISAKVQISENVNHTVLNEFKIFVKEFLQDIEERESFDLSTTTVDGTFQTIANFTIQNVDHSDVDVFVFGSTSIKASGTTGNIDQQVNIVNGSSVTGFVYENSIPAGEERVTMSQDLLESASIDTYTIQMNSSCDATSCTLLGSDLTAYFANIIPASFNSFNISVFDNFDNTSVSNFTVEVSGTNFSTTAGSVQVFTSGIVNLTITSEFNGGYFSTTVLNHNANNDLNVSLNQTLISWNCIEKISGADLNCSQPPETQTFNYNVIGNPHTQSLNVTGYYELIQNFNVTALQNNTINTTFFSTNQTFTTSVVLGGGTPGVCGFTVSSLNHSSFTETVNGTGGNSTIGLINGTYQVSVDCVGYAITSQTFLVENLTQTLNIELSTTESVNFIFRDADSFDLLNNTNITINFIGATSFTNSTTNGTLFIDLITPSTYTITASADGYRQTQYLITVSSRSFQNVTILMQNVNNSELVLISVKDKFSSAPIRLSKVTIQKFVNNAWITDQILETDFQGRTEGHFVLSTVFYNFLVEFNNQTFFGVINSNEDKKVIFAEDVSNGIVIEIDTDPNEAIDLYQLIYAVSTTMNFTNTSNTTGTFRFAFVNNNGFDTVGNLLVYQDGLIVCNETVTSSTGTMFCNVNSSGQTALFTAGGFINGELVNLLQQRLDPEGKFLDWGVFGWWMALVIYTFSWFIMLRVPSVALPLAYGSLSALIFFEVILRGLSVGFWLIFLVMAFMILKVPIKRGV